MADILLTFSPHFMNAGAGDILMRIDSEESLPVPKLPSTATEGSRPGTALVSSLQVGNYAYVAGFVHEIKEIDTDPDWE